MKLKSAPGGFYSLFFLATYLAVLRLVTQFGPTLPGLPPPGLYLSHLATFLILQTWSKKHPASYYPGSSATGSESLPFLTQPTPPIHPFQPC